MPSMIHDFDLSERASVELTAAGSVADVMISAAAVFAALTGLFGLVPIATAACATLAIGAALLFEGGAIGARFAPSLKHREEDSLTKGDVLGGITADFIAGIAGIVFGALALGGIAPMPLIATAVLVYSAALLIGCAALVHATTTLRDGVALPSTRADTVLLAAGAQLVVGIVAFVLGFLALLGVASMTLMLVSLLLIAISQLASGMALGSKMVRMLRTRGQAEPVTFKDA